MPTQSDPQTTRSVRWLDLIRASGDQADMGRAITRLATLAAAAHRGQAADVVENQKPKVGRIPLPPEGPR